MDYLTIAQLLGNYGEFIGSIAVVVTLFFVGFQVRESHRAMTENNKLAKLASLDESRRAFSTWRMMLATDPKVSSLWQAGLTGKELDSDQRFRFGVLVQEQQFLLNTAFDRYVEHDMRTRANAMARGMAMTLEQNTAVPEPIWLPGTEEFRDEVQRQRSAIQTK